MLLLATEAGEEGGGLTLILPEAASPPLHRSADISYDWPLGTTILRSYPLRDSATCTARSLASEPEFTKMQVSRWPGRRSVAPSSWTCRNT